MRYFIFNYIDETDKSFTIIFDNHPLLSDKIESELKYFHTYNEQCYYTIYVCPKRISETEERTKELIAQYSYKSPDSIKVMPYTNLGIPINSETQEILLRGLLAIIKRRNALLESDDNFHYVLPSEKHSPFFIRTGNILVESSEISFIALALMSIVDVCSYSFILCDTSSILPIPYALGQLLGLFGYRLDVPFVSFGSYNSLDDFDFKPNSLVLISASNSGDLETKIRKKQRDLGVVTIILNSTKNDKKSLINIHEYLTSLLYNKITIQHKTSSTCEYCNRNSIPVVVRGEQFIPSRILIQRVLFLKNHVPSWVNVVAKTIVERRSISVNRRENTISKRREIFIDVERLITTTDNFYNELDQYLSNYIPTGINQIIYVKENASKKVSEIIQKKFENLGVMLPSLLAHTELQQLDRNKEYNFLVVVACTTTGNKLNSISRDIRDFSNSSVHYLSVISRLENQIKEKTLIKNLEYKSKEKKKFTHKFHNVFCCYLGDHHDLLFSEYEKPPWENELDFWRKQVSAKSYIETRKKNLESNEGLIEDLFFLSPFTVGSPTLRLRKNFAFFDFSDNRSVTQADVYFIVSSIFHSLRNPNKSSSDSSDGQKYLIQHEHVKSILDPECFKRYNDGIIQSCMLRCARPSELNYSSSEKDSREILETLKDILKREASFDTKEAILEFIYAIASGKLRLQEEHKIELINTLRKDYESNELIVYFLDLCK